MSRSKNVKLKLLPLEPSSGTSRPSTAAAAAAVLLLCVFVGGG